MVPSVACGRLASCSLCLIPRFTGLVKDPGLFAPMDEGLLVFRRHLARRLVEKEWRLGGHIPQPRECRVVGQGPSSDSIFSIEPSELPFRGENRCCLLALWRGSARCVEGFPVSDSAGCVSVSGRIIGAGGQLQPY